jgi:TonB family protein
MKKNKLHLTPLVKTKVSTAKRLKRFVLSASCSIAFATMAFTVYASFIPTHIDEEATFNNSNKAITMSFVMQQKNKFVAKIKVDESINKNIDPQSKKQKPIVETKETKATEIEVEVEVVMVEAKALMSQNKDPKYPRIAKKRNYEGTVILHLKISDKGIVSEIRIQHSSGYRSLDESAIRAVRLWKFSPAMKNQRNISSELILPVQFRLK